MSPEQAVGLALVIGAALIWVGRKPIRKAVGGWISTDKHGRITIALTPARKRKGRKRK